MENKTPIQEWIEKESKQWFYKDGFMNGCRELLKHLGLQDIADPKNHIRHLQFRANEGLETSKEFDDFKENAERLSLKYSFKLESLEAENERLKEFIQMVLRENMVPAKLRVEASKALKGETT